MNERCCPCGARLDRSTCIRPLKTPGLRMFMSIRSLKSLTSDHKVCNVCRHLYSKWKSENLDFSSILDRLESDSITSDDDINDISVIDFCFQFD